MTAGELKFALELESKLNRIPQPEYRQLLVEALMVLSIVIDCDPQQTLGGYLNMDEIVQTANLAFLHEQVLYFAVQCTVAGFCVSAYKSFSLV